MVLVDVVTGLRASELFALKWSDINFNKNEISVTRSIVMQVVGSCKTEASQKPVPLDPLLAKALRAWRLHTNTIPQKTGFLPARTAKAESHIGGNRS